jgi:hypothetical protein|tara:strand:+ start:499 stop:966 length:468 start_codon:yes stop_codon:yes gene_type:complete
MVTFRSNNNNNSRRPPFRSNNNRRPPYRSNNEGSRFSNNDNFQRNIPGRNNHNASKLIEKYNNLAREAITSGDKILSENYFQHADHFTRVLGEQESHRKSKFLDNSTTEKTDQVITEKTDQIVAKKIDQVDSKEKQRETVIKKASSKKIEEVELK